MSLEPSHSVELEQLTRKRGTEILRRARAAGGAMDHWLGALMQRSLTDQAFRVQVLRFMDVLPVLGDDRELVRHLQEYFSEGDLPLPGLARWGLRHGGVSLAPAVLAAAVRRAAAAMAGRFLAGDQLSEVLATVARLESGGVMASLDRLGEAVVSEAEAETYQSLYLALIGSMGEARLDHPHLSIKASSLHSQARPWSLEHSRQRLLARLRPVLLAARQARVSVCLDMEHYELKELILSSFQELLMEPGLRDWEGASVALQTYLRDTPADLEALLAWARSRGSRVGVRLVRGAYWDQEVTIARQHGWPLPVWPDKPATDLCFEACLGRLMENHEWLYPAIASHNVRSLALAGALAEQHGMAPADYEFQLLHGMGEALVPALRAMGNRVRIYLPFGPLLPGMAYLVRRLLENSSNASFLNLGTVPEGDEDRLLAPPGPLDEVKTVALGFQNEALRRFTTVGEREAFAAALGQERQALGGQHGLYIAGREVFSGEWLDSFNPARPEELVGRVARAEMPHLEQAVEAARAALPDWRGAASAERLKIIRKAAELLRRERDGFAALEVYEAGKSWSEADADVAEAIDFLSYYADQAEELDHGWRRRLAGEDNRMRYVARGVVAVIPPWNFPLAILVGMSSAALVTGNTVVLKPASLTPVLAARYVDLLVRAGLPDGVLNLVVGAGDVIGEALVRHPGVSMVAFTGSLAVGQRIQALAADLRDGQRHLKRVVAELGGKNAIIIDSDADLDDAVPAVLASAFGFQGQKCSACSRLIVVGARFDALARRLVEATASLAIGPPDQPQHLLGPVIDGLAQRRIEALIERGRAEARLLYRGQAPEQGYYVPPILFSKVREDSFLAQEEIFGPVLSLLRARDFNHALAIANATRYALTGGLFSRSPSHLEQARRQFEVGNLYLNRGITGALVGRQPFGGFRLSGVGSKAGGPDYLLQFVEPRVVTENTLRRGFAPD